MNRATLAEESLLVIQDLGLEALTMRSLGQRAGVKAASLYWHVRDREELLELVADALLARVTTRTSSSGWRTAALSLCRATATVVAQQRDGGRLLQEVPGALRRSDVFARVVRAVAAAGIPEDLARELAVMMLSYAAQQRTPALEAPLAAGRVASLAIDSGSRGVVVHAGTDMDGLVRIPHDPSAAAPAVVRGESVVVRRLRGGKHGEIELNPMHPWSIRIQGPTWNTVLDLRGLDVRDIKFDSSAAKVDCILGRPRGVVPIKVSSGVLKVAFHRSPGTAVEALASSGSVQVAFDGFRPRSAVTDVHWDTPDALGSADRYQLTISTGAVRISLDQAAPESDEGAVGPATATAKADAVEAALSVLLDGIAARVTSG